MTFAIRADIATHAGAVRPRNEDSVLSRPGLGLWVVADGAGGHGGGAQASQAAVAALAAGTPDTPALVRARLAAVHAALQQQAAPGSTMATTVVAVLASGAEATLMWAGDSRAYLLRAGQLTRLTHDHSLVQELVDQGTLTPAEAERHPQGNVILHAIGAPGAFRLDEKRVPLAAGDRLLLCSDGLYRTLAETVLAARLGAGIAAAALVEEAVAAGARDNVSAAVLLLQG